MFKINYKITSYIKKIDILIWRYEERKETKKKNIRGVVITHGHYDHIGGIPHLMTGLGNPPIYGLPITNAIIKKRQEDYKGMKPLNLKTLKIDL
mgnify:CR=1 FL=1